MSKLLAARFSDVPVMVSADRAGWLALMAEDVLIEDPIGEAPTNADGTVATVLGLMGLLLYR